MDYKIIYDEGFRQELFKANPDFIREYLPLLKQGISSMPLSKFAEIYVNAWDPEALQNGWHGVNLQDYYEEIWTNHPKSIIKAPRGHLKTTSVLEWVVKQLILRNYPLEVNYYHWSVDLAIEKLRKIRRIIEANPVLRYFLQIDEAQSLKQDLIVLKDGTMVQPLSWKTGVIGKHPHIIVLDDVISKDVIYSDELNKKAIEKYYLDINPMITKMTEDKKIIVIGTSQRKDDLYETLPADFHKIILQAIVDEDKKQTLAPDLYTYDDLMKMRDSILNNPLEGGERFWLKEYMNIPFDRLGTIVKKQDILYYTQDPFDFARTTKLVIFQGWDISVGKDLEKADWTAGATLGIQILKDGTLLTYLLEMFVARILFNDRLEAIKNMYNRWREFYPAAIGIESVSFQYDTIQELIRTTNLPIIEVKAIKNKIESFQTELGPYFERHKVYIHESMKGVETELLSLPTGSHDDQADALKIAIKTALFMPIGGAVSDQGKVTSNFTPPRKDSKDIPSQASFGTVRSKQF